MSSPVRIPVMDIAKHGLILDTPAHKVHTGAWTGLQNMHISDGFLRVGPTAKVLLTPSVAPYAIFPSPSSSELAVYFGLEKAYAFNVSAQAEITRTSSDYSTPALGSWNHTLFHGFGIYNNGADPPQQWEPAALTTLLTDLSAWPASTSAKVLRSFKTFLIALDITKAAGRSPRMVKWSDAADPDTLPASWDPTDATRLAGELTLAEGASELIDCGALGDLNIVYTGEETWAMRLSSGISVFDFYRLFEQSGLLAQDCFISLRHPRAHFAVTQDDFVTHNGQQIQSVGDGSVTRWFFRNLNPAYYYLTRCVHLPELREIWVHFPTVEAKLDHVLVWNYAFGAWSMRTTDSVRAVSSFRFNSAAALDDWDSEESTTWSFESSITWTSPGQSRLTTGVFASPVSLAGITYTHPDNAGTAEINMERTGIIQVDREAVDEYSYKQLVCIRPHVNAPAGTVLIFRGGTQEDLYDPVAWTAEKTFVVGTDTEVNFYVTGRYLAFSVRCSAVTRWEWHGYTYEILRLGEGR